MCSRRSLSGPADFQDARPVKEKTNSEKFCASNTLSGKKMFLTNAFARLQRANGKGALCIASILLRDQTMTARWSVSERVKLISSPRNKSAVFWSISSMLGL